jgi:hypothetical protein
MKQLVILIIAVTLAINVQSQCTPGGDGIAVSAPITVDGNVSDWSAVIADPDNFSNDAVPDMDAPIADIGRDFTKFAFTQSWSTLYLYFARAGSATNAVDALLYLDVDNNGLMETNEPVIAISWSGSNGNGKVDIYNYVEVNAGGDPVSGDGVDMPGSLILRAQLGTIGSGTTDGYALEVGIPFQKLYKQGSSDLIDWLQPNESFKFHLSTINGNPTSVPGPNAINDNFNGCYWGFMVLPVELEYFEAKTKKAGLDLTWKVTENESAARFEIEASTDGQHFETIGAVDATQNEGSQVYTYFVSGNEANNYYRLKMIGSDGGIEYSKILVINTVGLNSGNLKVSNPVHSAVTILYESAQNERCNIRIFNIAGAQVYAQAVNIQAGSNRIVIPGSALNTSGTYVLVVTDHLDNRSTHKLVKM